VKGWIDMMVCKEWGGIKIRKIEKNKRNSKPF
jgi:hypothetical protein